jgi:putative endopeptidase
VKRFLLSTLSLSLVAAFAGAAEPNVQGARMSGIELQHIDAGTRAQDDFFNYLTGKWQKTAEIPADKSRWGSFDKLADDTTPLLRELIETAQKDRKRKAGSEEQKIGDLYASFMDEGKLQSLGYKPLTGELRRVRALRDKKAVPALIAHLAHLGVAAPYAMTIGQDSRESTRYAAFISQSGLGMPDRDYYLKMDDAKLSDVRAKYLKTVETMLGLAGTRDAAGAAKAILAFETELAQVQWSRTENRDPVKRYNKMDIAKLEALAPGYDWKGGLAGAGIANKVDYVIVGQPSYLKGYGELIEKTELATLKAYFEWHLVRAYAPYLSKEFVDASFAFYGTAVSGLTANQPRWKRGVGVVEGALGEALGKQYVAKHFPAERKARMEVLVANVLEAFKQSIDTLDWMSPETKKEAQAKLAKFRPKIGYPNKWRDYSTLAVERNDLVGNVMRARTFAYKRNVNKLGKPIDREEWGMTPQTVNAYYSSTMNEIVFPASILQPPFFDMGADDAVNYGGIGAVIGHEISHGFDDNGSKSDGDGNLRDWWTAEDRAKFQVKANMLVKQYSGYSPLPGYNVNGQLTLGENIGDNSGLAIAFKAYKISLKGKDAAVIDGYTGEQRFYMGWGQVWRAKTRDAEAINRVKTDTHSPAQFRANGTLRNQQGFYDAFGVKEGDKMYLAPQERVTIW